MLCLFNAVVITNKSNIHMHNTIMYAECMRPYTHTHETMDQYLYLVALQGQEGAFPSGVLSPQIIQPY